MSGAEASYRRLTHPRTIASGAVWNFAGRAGPLVVAVLVTPALVRLMGVDRWGVFTLALSLVGIAGIFDFGFGRALTRLIADRIATGEEAHAANAVISGLAVLAALGTLGALALAGFAGLYTSHALQLPPALQTEVRTALIVLALSTPLVVLGAALWGVLAAFQRFAAANMLMLPIQALYYLGPLAVLWAGGSLVAVMAVLVACRAAMCLGLWRICIDAMPSLTTAGFERATIAPLLRFGSWLTVSNLVWPLLLYLDRFVIAALISTGAAAYYATPFDLIIRFSVLPVAIMQTAFPAMATTHRRDPIAAARLFRRSTLAILVLLLPAAIAVVGFAEPLLRLWLGADFAAQAAPVLRVFGVGVLFMCADSVPVTLLDGVGRPDLNAKLSLALLVLYIPVLLCLIAAAGIRGAALAWTLRVIAGYAIRLALAVRAHPALAAELRFLLPAGFACLAVMTGLALLAAG